MAGRGSLGRAAATRSGRIAGALALAALASPAGAQDAAPVPGVWEREHPLEAWQAAATRLGDLGLETVLFYTLDALANVDGGVREDGALIGNLDLQLGMDLESLFQLPRTRLQLYLIANHGELSPDVGDVQGVSNIEAPATVKLFEAWVEHELEDAPASLLAGLYDSNSEFDVIPSAALFLNGSQGMGAELGNSGRNGPSTFPVTSLALRAGYEAESGWFARAAVLDGVPGDPADDKRTQVELDGDDGQLLIAELGFLNVPSRRLRGRTRRYFDEAEFEDEVYGFFGKFALGAWRYTGRFDDVRDSSASRNASPGVYALAEQRVYYEPQAPAEGLSVFARAGLADGRVQPIDGYLGAGLVYRGLLPDRPADELGFGVAAAHFGSPFRAGTSSPEDWEEWEVSLELTYRWRFAPWLSLQPDIQHVVHPGGDPALDDALVVGLRTLVSF